MKILQIPPRFYPYIGGVENYVYNLSKQMVKLGHEVKVVCAREPEDLQDYEIIDEIEVERLNYISKIANTNITPKLPFELLKEDFDIIHTHLPTPWSADWSAIISKIKSKPLILTYHNDITGSGFAKYIAKFYNHTSLKFLLNSADKIIITQPNYINSSPYLSKYKNKIEVIPNGVDITKFKPVKIEKEENTLFFLSVLDEFHRYKGLDFLLEALKRVKKKIPNVRMIVGGEGKLLNYYKQKVISMGLQDNVEFAGFIPDEQIVEYYSKCDAFVLPSILAKQEGFGIVLLEAMACEKPVVSTEIVGVAEDVKERNAGGILKPNDEKAFAEAIIKILTDKDLAMKMGINGRKLVEEKYTWEMIAAKVLDVYEEML